MSHLNPIFPSSAGPIRRQAISQLPSPASGAVLHAGAGVVRLLHGPNLQMHQMGLAPEVIAQGAYPLEESWKEMKRARALFVGPGLGTGEEAQSLFDALLPHMQASCVFDADALTILAQRPDFRYPPQSILTPHAGEMERLLGKADDLLKAAHAYAQAHDVVIVLKGAPTFVLVPQERPYVIDRGDPGMATAGAGDVLTGVIAGLLAQGLCPREAALLGATIHGMAGEIASAHLSPYAMMASDITAALGEAFLALQRALQAVNGHQFS